MKRASTVLLAAAGALALAASPAAAGPVNTNSAAYWSAVTGDSCSKTEYPSSPEVTYWTSDGYYTWVFIKGGASTTVSPYGKGVVGYENVQPGQNFDSAVNSGGQLAAISWLITCTGGSSGGSSAQ
jgi:hypothetical protein